MKRVLLDTNVVLDALLERAPWVTEARAIWEAHLVYRIAAHITATSLTDIFYVSRRTVGLARRQGLPRSIVHRPRRSPAAPGGRAARGRGL